MNLQNIEPKRKQQSEATYLTLQRFMKGKKCTIFMYTISVASYFPLSMGESEDVKANIWIFS